jgi:hypothetical protein
MYVNAKMRPAESILGMEGRGIKESDGGSEFKYDIFDAFVGTFVNITMYPHLEQQFKK